MTSLTHLDWQPVILLKVVRLPFGGWGGLSLQRAYLALDNEQLLYADWTLEADERAEAVVCATGWTLPTLPDAAFRLHGKGAKLLPSGTWVLPYTDSVFSLYGIANAMLIHLIRHIDQQPTDPLTLSLLSRLTQLL
ncbi:hypothetical protein PLCT1_00097 [Planctomycetaceae bacterium]|nr:hypothetical protein PLCT1_00097 [Planctomycetaceae bacterium]